jgi:hypothetical protein
MKSCHSQFYFACHLSTAGSHSTHYCKCRAPQQSYCSTLQYLGQTLHIEYRGVTQLSDVEGHAISCTNIAAGAARSCTLRLRHIWKYQLWMQQIIIFQINFSECQYCKIRAAQFSLLEPEPLQNCIHLR